VDSQGHSAAFINWTGIIIDSDDSSRCFPVVGAHSCEAAPLAQRSESIKGAALDDVDDSDECHGTRYGRRQGRHVAVPLGEVKVDTDDRGRQSIDAYQVWFWNGR
jgi:hypothetical protein